MSDKTFIEIWHEDKDATVNWFATKSVTRWKDGNPVIMNSWQLNGSNIHVYDLEDIKALRTLLEEIEKEFI